MAGGSHRRLRARTLAATPAPMTISATSSGNTGPTKRSIVHAQTESSAPYAPRYHTTAFQRPHAEMNPKVSSTPIASAHPTLSSCVRDVSGKASSSRMVRPPYIAMFPFRRCTIVLRSEPSPTRTFTASST
jgi:hypothetical protein